jgi:tetratricopeptide (TPR) repeat protein
LAGEILARLDAEPNHRDVHDTEGRHISRRTLFASAAAATLGVSVLGWTVFRLRPDGRFSALVAQADQILRHEYSERALSPSSLLRQALAISPDDPHALGLLAYADALAATGGGATESGQVAAAERSINAAIAADPDDSHARLAALLFRRGALDWAATEDELRAILRTAPRNPLALGHLNAFYQAAGRTRLSWNLNEALVAIDPLSPSPRFRWALKHWIYGRTFEAHRMADQLIHMWPRHPFVWNARFLILAFTGRPHAALDMIDDAASRPETITPARMAQWRPTLLALERPSASAIAAAREANLVAARQSPGQAAYAVMALAGIGEVDAAYEVADGFLLSRGRIVTRRPTDRSNMLVNTPGWRRTQWLATPPLIDFRADPRFGGLCDGIGLTAYWRTRRVEPDYPNIRTG